MKAAALLLLSLGLGLAGVVGVAAAPNRTDVFGLDPEGELRQVLIDAGLELEEQPNFDELGRHDGTLDLIEVGKPEGLEGIGLDARSGFFVNTGGISIPYDLAMAGKPLRAALAMRALDAVVEPKLVELRAKVRQLRAKGEFTPEAVPALAASFTLSTEEFLDAVKTAQEQADAIEYGVEAWRQRVLREHRQLQQ